MKVTNYRKSSHTVYDIKFHIVWITKYRYKILKGNIAHRLVALLKQGCEAKEIEIIKGHVSQDHVHMLIEVDPQFGVHKAVKRIKGYSSRVLRSEFSWLKSRIPTLWTNSYFVSTVGGAPLFVIKQYIENQKNV